MNRALGAILVVLDACAPRASQMPPVAAPTDLWSFAPADAGVGLVARDGSLGALVRGLRLGLRYWESADPDGVAELRGRLAGQPTAWAFLDDALLAEHGIDLALGFAMYTRDDDRTWVLPVGNRERFRASVGASISTHRSYEVDHLGRFWCAEIRRRYVCVTNLDRIAELDAHPAPAPEWTRAAGGDVEARVDRSAMTDVNQAAISELDFVRLDNLREMRMTARLEPGAATVRMHFVADGAAGTRPPWPAIAALAANPPALVAIIRSDKFADSMKHDNAMAAIAEGWIGDFVVSVPTGDRIDATLRTHYRDAASAKAILARCAQVLGSSPPPGGDPCVREVAFPPIFTGVLAVTAEDRDLVISARETGLYPAAPTAAAPSAAFAELLAGTPTIALWGRGILALGGPGVGVDAVVGRPNAATMLWFMTHVAEIGAAVEPRVDGAVVTVRLRTTFANPDEVVSALEPLLYRAMRGDVAAAAEIRALAGRFPRSPLAADVATGTGAMRLLAIAMAATLAR